MQVDELKGIITARGKTQKEVADILGISPKTFSYKLNNNEFGTKEVDTLIDVLDIKDPMWIFFNRKVTLKDTTGYNFTKVEKNSEV